MAVSNKTLEKMMSGSHGSSVGAGEPIDLESLTDSNGVDSGAFYEPFWDLEKYDDKGNPLGIDGTLYQENPWDCVQLGEYQLPGLWSASATASIKLDIQKPLNYDGAAILTRGYLPSSITLTGLLWMPLQWRVLQDLLPAIWRRPNKIAAQDMNPVKKGKVAAAAEATQTQESIVTDQRSFAILNPAINPLGIFYVVVQQVTPLVAHNIPGVRKMTIECVEYVPEPAIKKPATRHIKGGKTGKDRGKNAFDHAIEAKDARNPKPPSASKAALEPGALP